MFQKFIEQSDQNKSGDVSLAEFIHYVREHEKKLHLQFHSLDVNKDGNTHEMEMFAKINQFVVFHRKNWYGWDDSCVQGTRHWNQQNWSKESASKVGSFEGHRF